MEVLVMNVFPLLFFTTFARTQTFIAKRESNESNPYAKEEAGKELLQNYDVKRKRRRNIRSR